MGIIDYGPYLVSLLLTFKLVLVTGVSQLILLTPVAWLLTNKKKSKIYPLIETIITLPIFLPPTVLGFYYLVFFQGNKAMLFNFNSIFCMSFIASMPIYLKSAMNSFLNISKDELELAKRLGANNKDIFFKIVIPQSRYGLTRSIGLSIAHVFGSFGAILMVGGSIPGKTKVLSILLFEEVESLNFNNAHIISVTLVLLAIILMTFINLFGSRENG